jgi:beta-lactamase regulating signal transducer with metallopeptidase domain
MNGTVIDSLVNHPLVVALGWALVHSVWQLLLIAALVKIGLSVLRSSTANARYVLTCAGIGAMAAAPLATVAFLLTRPANVNTARTEFAAASRSGQQLIEPAQFLPDGATPQSSAPDDDRASDSAAGAGTTSRVRAGGSLSGWMAIGVASWCGGVVLLALRLLFGLQRVHRWQATATPLARPEFAAALARLRAALRIERPVRLLESARATVPAAMGWLRPAILVPTALVSGLTTAEIESLVAHELAHIRRHDYLANLVQNVLETLLFYHPAMWWLSHATRSERENCCDDLAAQVSGGRVRYAQSLARLEELRCGADSQLVVAASSGSLVARIKRLVGRPEPRRIHWWPAGLVSLTIVAVLCCGVWLSTSWGQPATALGDEPRANDAAPAPPATDDEKLTVTQKGHPAAVLPAHRSDVEVLDSHVYDSSRRESTGWVEVNGVSLPVDDGVEHDGIKVYVTLMFDVVAVDSATGKSLWHLDWNKTDPFWQAVSIVRWVDGDKTVTAAELRPGGEDVAPGDLLYVDLATGSRVDPPPAAGADARPGDDSQDRAGPDSVSARPQVVERDGEVVKRAVLWSSPVGRSATELLVHFAYIFEQDVALDSWVTNMETLVSAQPNYVLENAMDAQEVNFALPEGSRMRAEFSGEEVRIEVLDGQPADAPASRVVVTHGKVELIDEGGVTRATASADGGAEQLVVDIRQDADEWILTIRAQRVQPDADYPNPPVQVVMNADTGAPATEEQPPHGAVRYEILPAPADDTSPERMKMKWHYQLRRLADEAERETGRSWEEILWGGSETDAGGQPQRQSAEKINEEPSEDNAAREKPWSVIGRVTDGQGQPLAGVTVRAHCGWGTLRETGSATTGSDGRYELHFGPGMFSQDRSMVQAATISVDLAGHFEQNLHRQGDLLAAYELPAGEIGWGDKTEADVFLPGQPKQIDFVMVPAASFRGIVMDADGKRLAGVRVALTGPDLPPSSNVIDSVRTDDQGQFEIRDIPTGFKYQVLVEPAVAEPPWLAWASPPVEFVPIDSNDTRFRYTTGDRLVDISVQTLYIVLKGDGVNWKSALQDAERAQLNLQYSGLSNSDQTQVSAGMATITVGGD